MADGTKQQEMENKMENETMGKILIIGATSAMAHEAARCFAREGAELFLVGRNAEKLKAVQGDLLVRGARRAEIYVCELAHQEEHHKFINEAIATLTHLDAVLIAHGNLSDQEKCQQQAHETVKELNLNFLSAASMLTLLANYFELQGKGTLAVIGSVSGDRGRQSNYVYGTAKAALAVFLQGLRNRLHPAGVKVITLKPGFVASPMTAHMKHNALFVSSEKAGQAVYRAMKQGKDVVYIPGFWRCIMLMIIHIPEGIFKKLKL